MTKPYIHRQWLSHANKKHTSQPMIPDFQELSDNGFELLTSVFSDQQCQTMLNCLEDALQADAENFHVRQSRGTVFAARNLIGICPDVVKFWRTPQLVQLLEGVLGNDFGLVRVLFFDKPSDRSWSLPFHKDMTIAVRDNSLPTSHFCKPTHKAGVDHVEASEAILENMLTLRIHLDDVTVDNGPLQVIPGSHLSGKSTKAAETAPVKITCVAGDVLAMRPLISHGSAHSNPNKQMHRRILHLEFCGTEHLPDHYQWVNFLKH